MSPMRLITIPMSHYCEKARWGLERLGLAYTEERHLQGFHYPRTYWYSRGPTVPVLLDGAQVISDSTGILGHLDRYATPQARLYPENSEERDQVEQWEDIFDEDLGVESRRWVYLHYLAHPREALRVASQGAPAVERALFRLFYPLARAFLVRRVRVNARDVERGLSRARAIVRRTDALLSDGRKYLLGERFTAADLSLACMISPLILPRHYGIQLPTLEEALPAMRPTVEEFRSTLTGAFALRLFEAERLRVMN